ncbi:hypothetical protein AB0I28_32445 [Phytomonospora sp. NPDC050363]|uniref:hypothetical protein n=1 Tax=Phytomonospora sp. NPDC050363 TaxID=3155642 RepID=UPI0033F606DC
MAGHGVPIVRFAQLVCDEHIDEAVRTNMWPFSTLEARAIEDECRPCAARIWQNIPRERSITRLHADLSDSAVGMIAAVHEAGHALVGLAGAMDLEWIRIDPPRSGGTCRWAPGRWEATGYLAMLWAGGLAAQRWLAEQGLTDVADALDATAGAVHDHTEIRESVTEHSLPALTGRDQAVELLDTNWAKVSTVAAYLARHHFVTADMTHALISSATG